MSQQAWEQWSQQRHTQSRQLAPLPAAQQREQPRAAFSSPAPAAAAAPAPLACDSSSFECPLPPARSRSSNATSAAFAAVGDVFPDSAASPSQRLPLSRLPVSSNIPRSGVDPATSVPYSTWTFPSPQRFYNAMTRKGWQADERSIPAVVSIHNTVNEETWRRVLRYEERHRDSCPTSKLARFRGRPNDLSPKARALSLVGYVQPFDRHDWVVDRCGQEVRYIIDFYGGGDDSSSDGKAAAIHIDARPALDSFGAAWDRLSMQFRDWL